MPLVRIGGIAGWVAAGPLAIACLTGCGADVRETEPARPDVVLVTWDTTRADHVGPDAAVPGLTPHWDRMAAEGVRFATARTPSPMTLPAHASLLTGRLPAAHGARVNSISSLSDAAETLAERLAEAGWRTGAFVSAAVLDESFGLAQGFERYDDRVGQAAERGFGSRSADATVDAALAWVSGIPAAQPVFVWVHLFDPHAPWEPPPAWVAAHPGEPYRAEIAFTDDQTGRLLDELAAMGRLEKALLVMTADHGEGLGEHGERTHGYFLYDSTLRVPLLFRAGDRAGVTIARGHRIDAPVLLSDVAPTILDLLGFEPAGVEDGEMPIAASDAGVSLAPLLRGAALPARELALESVDPYFVFGAAPAFGVVDRAGGVWIDLPRRERYDTARDPGQLRNLYEPSLAAEADALFARHPRRWPPAGSSPVLDAQRREQLAALGYLAARTGATGTDEIGRRDPKDLLPVAALWMGPPASRRPDEALAQAERLAARFGPLPALAFFRADRLRELARPDEAIEVLRASLTANPSETRLRDELEAALRQRAADEALAERIRVTWARQPDHPGAVHDLAVVLHRLGAADEAESLYRQWLQRHPEDDATRLDLQRLLGARGAFDEALALLRAVPPGAARSAALDCAEGRLLAFWMDRPEDAKPSLRACRDKGAQLAASEIELIGGNGGAIASPAAPEPAAATSGEGP